MSEIESMSTPVQAEARDATEELDEFEFTKLPGDDTDVVEQVPLLSTFGCR